MKVDASRNIQKRIHNVIPGGAHTYAKGDDQFPESFPLIITRGKGSHVWDVDGNEFIEYGMGLRSVTLGHAFEPVVEAAQRQMQLGSNFVRPAAIELECAEQETRKRRAPSPSVEIVRGHVLRCYKHSEVCYRFDVPFRCFVCLCCSPRSLSLTGPRSFAFYYSRWSFLLEGIGTFAHPG